MTGKKDSDDKKDKVVAAFPAAARGRACPTCGNPVAIDYRPFCSRRCADLDLGRWLREDYRIPAEEPPEGDEQEASGNAGGDVARNASRESG